MISSSSYKYAAFISYRHLPNDRKWAEWLIESLETFNVPKTLVKEGYPAKIRRVFRDEDELPSSADLSDQIYSALEASQYLIVVCSAETPNSNWVRKEIEFFKDIGRQDRILVLLINGEPSQSFPTPLLSRFNPRTGKEEDIEPLAADVRPREGISQQEIKTRALFRIIAALLGCGYDDLRRRHERREYRRRIIRRWSLIIVTLLSLLSCWYAWDYYRTKVEYFSRFEKKWQVPFGINKLTKSSYKKRWRTFKFEISQRKIHRISKVNSFDIMFDKKDQITQWDFEYDSEGKLVREKELNFQGEVLKEILYNSDLSVAYIKGKKGNSQPLTTELYHAKSAISLITQIRYTYNDAGYIVKEQFEDQFGQLVPNARSEFGKSYQRRYDGLISKSFPLNHDGKPFSIGTKYTYSDTRNTIETSHIDIDGKLINGDQGFATELNEYDQVGNITKISTLDQSQHPIRQKNGATTVVLEYTDHGLITHKRYYGHNLTPIPNKLGIHLLVTDYDSAGLPIEYEHFNKNNQRSLNKENFSKMVVKYDERFNTVEKYFYDKDDLPIRIDDGCQKYLFEWGKHNKQTYLACMSHDDNKLINTKGYSVQRVSYDQRDLLTNISYFDNKGDPVNIIDGYHQLKRKYDERGNQVETAYFNNLGQPTNNNDGYSIKKSKYNEKGQRIEDSYYDINHVPTINNAKECVVKYKYDKYGNIREYKFFNHLNKPSIGPGRAHQIIKEYGPSRLLLSQSYFGISGQSVLNNEGIHKWSQTYDRYGRSVKTFFYDINNQLIINQKRGSAIRVLTHDQFGNIISIKNLDVESKPMLNRAGYYEERLRFDVLGNVIERSYFDQNGNKSLSNGYHKYQATFDHLGNQIEIKTFDQNNNLVMNKFGYAIIKNKYQGKHLIEEGYFKENLLPQIKLPQVINTIDNKGRVIEKKFLNYEGGLVPGYLGSSIWKRKYKIFDQPTEIRFYDHKGNPHHNDHGYHFFKMDYDSNRKRTSICYLDTDNKPVEISKGYACMKDTYNQNGQHIEVRYTDVKGKPSKKINCPIKRFTYDTNGYLDTELCFDDDSKEGNDSNGIHKVSHKNDSQGNTLKVSYYDKYNKPTLKRGVYASARFRYNSEGKKILEEYFDVNGDPTLHQNGYHKSVNLFDEYGYDAGYEFFGVNGERLNSTFSHSAYIKIKNHFDGQKISIYHYDDKNNPTIAKQGYHARSMSYDSFGREVQRKFLDTHNQLMINPQTGCAIIIKKYEDFTDNPTSQKCLDTKNQTR